MSVHRLAVIILAAGQGTRMKSRVPKVLHQIGGKPLIGHVLATASSLSPELVITVVRHERDLVVPEITRLLPDAIIVDQDEVPGTGRAVELALDALPDGFDGDVVVVSGDVPLLDLDTLTELLEAHRSQQSVASILSAIVDDPTGYGRVVRAADGSIDYIIEQKDAAEHELAVTEINSGTYVFRAIELKDHLARVGTDNAQNEKYLTDVIGLLRGAGARLAALPVREAWLTWGVNDRIQLSDAARKLNELTVRRWQLEGVTVHDPASTWIDVDAQLAPDVELLPDTQIKGPTVIKSGAVIGPATTLDSCEVGENATVKRTDATLAVIGAGATVGPFAYLRPGTYLGENGKIGTFVETKNASIGRGSKVPHLSYIGDAVIGEETNLGAGAITANYDDIDKNSTEIGSHVHSGSHNVFVAPVRIGDGAKIGAGAVVRKDVPPGALAISVAPQRNMNGWTEANRPGTAAAKAAADAADEATE